MTEGLGVCHSPCSCHWPLEGPPQPGATALDPRSSRHFLTVRAAISCQGGASPREAAYNTASAQPRTGPGPQGSGQGGAPQACPAVGKCARSAGCSRPTWAGPPRGGQGPPAARPPLPLQLSSSSTFTTDSHQPRGSRAPHMPSGTCAGFCSVHSSSRAGPGPAPRRGRKQPTRTSVRAFSLNSL